MTFKEVFRRVIAENGIDILSSKQLVNILDDMGAFREENPALKKVMRSLMETDFSSQIALFLRDNDPAQRSAIMKTLERFKATSGFKEELINSLVGAFLSVEVKKVKPKDEPKPDERKAVNEADGNVVSVDEEPMTGQPQRKRVLFSRQSLIGIAVVISFLLVILYAATFMNTAKYRSQFASYISAGNTQFSKGKYEYALSIYLYAGEKYGTWFLKEHFKEKANKKAAEATAKIIEQWVAQVKDLLADDKVIQAKRVTLDLPSNMFMDDTNAKLYKDYAELVDNKLRAKAKDLLDELIDEIYTSEGSLSEDSQKQMNDLLRVWPDNYWLNFISQNLDQLPKPYPLRKGFIPADKTLKLNIGDAGREVDDIKYQLLDAGIPLDESKLLEKKLHLVFTEDMLTAVKVFQAFYGLPPTGELTPETLNKLRRLQ